MAATLTSSVSEHNQQHGERKYGENGGAVGSENRSWRKSGVINEKNEKQAAMARQRISEKYRKRRRGGMAAIAAKQQSA